MPNTSNQAIVVSVVETLKELREQVKGIPEADSRRKQEIAKRTIPELELNAYIHCYGD